MITYIIQSTIIWLISLIVFDLLLRHTSLHRYNRGYLITTLLMGALLPLYHGTNNAAPVQLMRPLIPAAIAEQHFAQAITPVAAAGQPWLAWIAALYAAGCVCALILLIREALLLLRWYRRGRVEAYDGFRLVSTEAAHGPFSVLRCVFISDKRLYSEEELRMILRHESVHIRRLHYLDKALVLLMRCVFWAHPLVYVYYRRLIMVHEFEADAVLRPQSRSYAAFLIQQSFDGGTTPAIAHSFFQSPLKTRINMLTKNTTRGRRIACTLALPLVTAFTVLWVTKSAAHKKEQHGNVVTFGANQFELGLPDMDGKPAPTGQFRVRMGAGSGSKKGQQTITAGSTTIKADTIKMSGDNGKDAPVIMVQLDPSPLKMNGEKIYDEEAQSTKAAVQPNGPSLASQLVNAASARLSGLPDGLYNFSVYDLIVDKNGHIVYYTIQPPSAHTQPVMMGNDTKAFKKLDDENRRIKAAHPVPQSVKDETITDIEHALDNIQLIPASKDGQAVIAKASYLIGGFGRVIFSVRNHTVTGQATK